MSENVLLEMRHISKVYGNGVYANRDINFSLREGEIHALVGENGAGKSTLMKVLFGMETVDQGDIILRGEKMVFHSPQDAMAVGIGMVHQHFKLVESMSVYENIILGYEPTKRGFIDVKAAKEKVREVSKIFEIEELLDIPVEKLPVGTKQKVEIVKALYRGAKILILDEPTAVLTPQETEKLFIQLKDLKKKGFTVIFISHKLREVKELSDRISIMRKGKMRGTVNTEEITEKEVSALMVGNNYTGVLEKKIPNYKDILLKVKDLTKNGAGEKNIVNKVSFTVSGGEILGIAGVEGNGQNELIEMITGMLPVDGGMVELQGTDITNTPIKNRRKSGMAYIPSDRIEVGMATSMSIEENIITTKLDQDCIYTNNLLSAKKIEELSGKLIEDYMIRCDGTKTEGGMLSGGNMQKVVVAREFTQNAKVIVAEQPTRGVDIGAAKFIHEKLVELRDEGCAVILISADMEELLKLSDHIAVMYDGEFSAYYEDVAHVTENELGYYMLGVKKQTKEEIGGAFYEKEKFAV